MMGRGPHNHIPGVPGLSLPSLLRVLQAEGLRRGRFTHVSRRRSPDRLRGLVFLKSRVFVIEAYMPSALSNEMVIVFECFLEISLRNTFYTVLTYMGQYLIQSFTIKY